MEAGEETDWEGGDLAQRQIDPPPAAGPAADRVTNFVGLRFEDMSLEAALDLLGTRDATTPFQYVVTPNVDHVVRLADIPPDDEIAQAYRRSWLCLCDSRVLALLARLRGHRLHVVSGSDLVDRLLKRSFKPGDRIALIGSNAEGASRLRSIIPGVEIVHHDPPMGLLHDEDALTAAVQFVVSARARYTFIAVGSPQQEVIAYRAMRAGGARGTGLCIGASIDFVTGQRRRAPRWVRRLCLEWLHRLLSDPRRLWRRYLVAGPRIFGIVSRASERRRP